MLLDIGYAKFFILVILAINLFFFSIKELRSKKEVVLMAVFLFLLCLGTLLSILYDFTEIYAFGLLNHLIGVAFVGLTAMFIAISANVRMKKVLKKSIESSNIKMKKVSKHGA